MRPLHRVMAACFGLSGLLYVLDCGVGGGGGGGGNLSINVSASATTVQAGATTSVSATVMHAGGNPAVRWTLTGSTCPTNCGALSGTGNS